MRVVSGSCKGRPLKAVPGNTTRPTTDKVKEALFNMIGPYFDGGIGLDLFAGSGGLGIEGISRGLEKVIFIDREPKAIHVIQENIKACKMEEKSEVYRNDAERALKALIKRSMTFDYIFLDPPYKKQQLVNLMEKMDQQELVNPDGVIVCEHSFDVELPSLVGRFKQIKHEKYGVIAVTIYSKLGNEEELSW
ncbi:16S rRNA (guanine(966)-N(2))-methyltransferase RsmD [Neobacillus cucumis]|uniref:16S rRNA (guanine(966)-N(2))-methyltransferase RsmD n=1 Tax=Neobacillus cucumis TaxID=1740721 RepID=UPI001962BAD2|nr:16S rRNA (guanine(966)-N(2))-methyltransferase RsmD [Neobacillus cucumis]MBM7654094.1 16S rRNA (guanine(966)-N(2))-methyltransferase RsmD [Neobacillus cucumis]MED4226114.1 16S rRNA (guanine(966)-N(2))-methyltransferase RsmD [Neobacillus cucumis]